jgi:hypothetical protein
MQLKEGSEYLENWAGDLLRIWEALNGKVVACFYETMKTPTVKKVNNTCPTSMD